MTNVPPATPPPDQPTGGQPAGRQQPTSTPSARPPLRRSDTDRLAGGVCGGLAEYSGIDSLLWRVGFVGLTLAGGAGVVVYLLLWVLMPPAPGRPDVPTSALEQLVRRMHVAVSGGLRTTTPHP
ncbi:MAG: putative stress-responsive transcriptional regulator [Blastococcus sp.]|nr:putative stress-responsive transcriptional regulator [Blastococcus sp.]